MTLTAEVPVGGSPGRRVAPDRSAWLCDEARDFAGPPPWLEDFLAEGPEPGPLPPDPLGVRPAESDPLEPPDQDGLPTSPADFFAALDPGPLLAAELEDIDPRTVDEYDLVEMVAGYHRLAAWAQGRMTDLTGVLARRPALNPHHPLPDGDYNTNVTAEELAPRLGLSRFAAKRMVTNSRAFRQKLEDTGTALREGRIDYPKACTLVRLLADQPFDVAWEVQQLVLPDAPHQSQTQLTRAVQAAIIAVDPHRATQRHRRARDTRRVDHPRPLPDGMASMFAVMPATDAAGLDLALEAAARSAKASGDSRTLDQLRADALALMGHAALDRGFIGVTDPPAAGTEAPSDADDDQTADDDGQTAADDGQTGTDDGQTAADDDQTAADEDQTATDGNRNATDDEQTAADDGQTAADDGQTAADDGQTAPDADHATSGDDHAVAFQTGGSYLRTPRMPVGGIGGRRTQIKVTVPLSVLIPPGLLNSADQGPGECSAHLAGGADPPGCGGPLPHAGDGTSPPVGRDPHECLCPDPVPLDDDADDLAITGALDLNITGDDEGPLLAEVAELDGYGPISPDVARALAGSADTWQRLVTDPLSGELLDVGRTRYRPPAAIADFVRHRDRTCVRPGCSSPAQVCDLDHVIAWEDGGITAVGNLAALCERDHITKTVGAFRLRHLGGGTFEWMTPSGHCYRRDHRGRITMVEPPGERPADDPPPF
ncbi:DUF222 domain-containing protein [Georgenia sp. MJ170]|uniref:HNH endonuclease signature motif containing protein n=1 Tax=Georgenia sunbinii TaxID=3117728 RepID=UPI002F25F4E2